MSRGSATIDITASNPFDEGNHNVDVTLETHPHLENKEYVYDYGYRRRNDEEVSHMVDSRKFEQPQNVSVTLRLPLEYRRVINYVEIKVDQSSAEHECKIISGGIGQSFIELLLTAKNTYWFNYDARFYARGRMF